MFNSLRLSIVAAEVLVDVFADILTDIAADAIVEAITRLGCRSKGLDTN